MEIERKFIPKKLPDHLEDYPCHEIEQGYLCTNPAIRIRKMDDSYFLTYKSSGMMAHEEYEMPLTQEAYLHLRQKTDGMLITKCRYLIPLHAVFSEPAAPAANAPLDKPHVPAQALQNDPSAADAPAPLLDHPSAPDAPAPRLNHPSDALALHSNPPASSLQDHPSDHALAPQDHSAAPLCAPATHMIELDIFRGALDGIILAEVEFASIEEAESFLPPEWFGEDVTYDGRYHNSAMSRGSLTSI